MADDAITISVRIMGREYTVSCPPDEHETLVASAELLNERMSAIRRRGKALGTERIAVMAALNLARELLAGGGSKEDRAARERASERIKQLRLDIDSTIARNS